MIDIREEIDSAIEHWQREMPEEIKTLAARARVDLHNGPVYLDEDGEEVSCFDDGARQFNFSAACAKISEWAEGISDVEVEVDFDGEAEESVYERVDGSAEQIMREIFGRELAAYL